MLTFKNQKKGETKMAINPIGQNQNETVPNMRREDPFEMDVREYRASIEGNPMVNQVGTTITTVPITISVTKYPVTIIFGC